MQAREQEGGAPSGVYSYFSKETVKLLLIEDNEADFLYARELLTGPSKRFEMARLKFEVSCAVSVAEAIELLEHETFNIVLLDLSLPDARGLEGLEALSRVAVNIPIVVFTGLDDETLARQAISRGAQDYLIKGEIDGRMLVRALLHTIERYHVLRELADAKQKAIASTKFKTEFLADMSHEIRTPLTPIVGFTEALRDPDLSEAERQKAIDVIGRCCNHLLRIVSDVLDLSKIEAGKLAIRPCLCSPSALLSEATQIMMPKAKEKSIALETTYNLPFPASMVSDPIRVKQILMNLISNAIKFTRTGQVKIEASYQEASRNVKFAVIDTGIGLSEKEQMLIFQPFFQGEYPRQQQAGGTGLGLTISERLSRMLGGSLGLNSVRGQGSIFTLTLPVGEVDNLELLYEIPVDPIESPSEPLAEVPALTGRVLLAEDGKDNQALISFFLRKCGLEVTVAEDGKQAVEKALASRFDLILMDMQMPTMDGYEATRQLRSAGYKGPIVALTAKAMVHDVEACAAAGCDDHLAKPFSQNNFFAKLTHYLKPADRQHQPITSLLEDTAPEYVKIILDFIDRLPINIAEIKAAYAEGDWKRVEALAHRMKSGCLFGFPDITDLAEKLEMCAPSGLPKEIGFQLQQLEALTERIRAGRGNIASFAKGKGARVETTPKRA